MKAQMIVVGMALVFVIVGSALGAASWEETAAGTQFRVDPNTNETQIGFYVALAYAPVPKCILLDVHWTVYHGDKLLAEDHHREQHDHHHEQDGAEIAIEVQVTLKPRHLRAGCLHTHV